MEATDLITVHHQAHAYIVYFDIRDRSVTNHRAVFVRITFYLFPNNGCQKDTQVV